MKLWHIIAVNEATRMDIVSGLVTLACVIVVVVAIEFSAPIIAGAAALGAAATGVWRVRAGGTKAQ